jgi:hypothetical protein
MYGRMVKNPLAYGISYEAWAVRGGARVKGLGGGAGPGNQLRGLGGEGLQGLLRRVGGGGEG